MVIYGYIWVCMVIYGYIWVCMVVYGYLWVCMVIYEYIRVCMVIYVYIYGYIWICMVSSKSGLDIGSMLQLVVILVKCRSYFSYGGKNFFFEGIT